MKPLMRYYNHPTYIKDAEEWSRKTHRERAAWIRENRLDEAESVLELGCGAGLQSDLFKNWVGLDIARECKPTVCADACHLPFVDDAFEAVIGINFIEHVEHQSKLLDECVRVAKKTVKFLSPTRDRKGGYPKEPDFAELLRQRLFGADVDAYGYDPTWVTREIYKRLARKRIVR